jgi:hypothetical protein
MGIENEKNVPKALNNIAWGIAPSILERIVFALKGQPNERLYCPFRTNSVLIKFLGLRPRLCCLALSGLFACQNPFP